MTSKYIFRFALLYKTLEIFQQIKTIRVLRVSFLFQCFQLEKILWTTKISARVQRKANCFKTQFNRNLIKFQIDT